MTVVFIIVWHIFLWPQNIQNKIKLMNITDIYVIPSVVADWFGYSLYSVILFDNLAGYIQ